MNYGELLLRGAERSTYRKRPIDTVNDIEQIKQRIKADKLAGKDVKIKQYEQQTKTGQAISEAKRKSGKKAFDEQIKLGKLSSKLAELKQKGASQEQIEQFYNRELKLEKLEKELNLLRDEPEKYFSKLQEIKELKNEEYSVVKILDQLKSQNASLSTLTTLYSGLLTPEQLLKSLPDFQDLTPKERDFALKTLRSQVKRDPASQKAFLQELAQQPKESIDRLKQGIKLEVLRLESEKPIKAKAVEVKEAKGSKKPQVAELTYEERRAQIDEAMDRVKQVFYDLMGQTRFDNQEQENYVGQQITILIEEGSIRESQYLVDVINGQIERFMGIYNYDKRKATDVLFRDANADEQKVKQQETEVRQAVTNVAENVASAQLGEVHPELKQIQPVLEQQFQDDDQLEPDQAQADALDVVQGVTQDLSRYGLQGPQIIEPRFNVQYPPTPFETIPSGRVLNSLNENDLKRLAYQFNVPFNDSDTVSELRRKLKGEKQLLLPFYTQETPLPEQREREQARVKREREREEAQAEKAAENAENIRRFGLKEVDISPDDDDDTVLAKSRHNNNMRTLARVAKGENLTQEDISAPAQAPAAQKEQEREEALAELAARDEENIRRFGLKEVEYSPDDDDDTAYAKAMHNTHIRALAMKAKGENLTQEDISAPAQAPAAQAQVRGQEKFKNNGAYNAFTNIPKTGILSKQLLDELNLKDLQQVSKDLGLNVEGKKNVKQSHINAIQKYKSEGKGFTPLSQYPHELVAGSLAHHINRVRNKRKLLNVYLHNPFQNTENEEYRKNLTKNTIANLLN